MIQRGLVHLYCGDGKGKTTAAFGLALRCAGHKEQVVIAQFLKDGRSGECRIMRELPNVCLFSANPTGKFTFQMTEEDKRQTTLALNECMQKAAQVASSLSARILILDEILAAITGGFIKCDDVLALLQSRPAQMEVVLTGRNPPQALIDYADYISKISKVKHPFDEGIKAREGIEW